jgi:hypothetical protein
VDEFALNPAGSLHGRLQRGRGCPARRAAATPGMGELVYDCVRRDPRWDALEDRGLYYARLFVDLELRIAPITAHLNSPDDHADTDPDRTNLAIDVLAHLIRLGRHEAARTLRDYAFEGANWYAAIAWLVELGDPVLAEGLGAIAVARCDDAELARLCGPDGAVTRSWALLHPRIAARRPCDRPPAPKIGIGHHTDDDLADLARGLGDGATAAILELGRRRSPLVLDLAEELLPVGAYDGPLCRAVRDLGPSALARARAWALERRSYHDVGIDVLASHGTEPDAPILLEAFDTALAEDDWDLAAGPADGLGRLRARAALPPLLRAWEQSACSHLRTNLLGALTGIDPHVAEPYLIEGLWDCEDGVRRIAAGAVPLEGEARSRLRRLRREAAEDPHVRSVAAARLLSDPG